MQARMFFAFGCYDTGFAGTIPVKNRALENLFDNRPLARLKNFGRCYYGPRPMMIPRTGFF